MAVDEFGTGYFEDPFDVFGVDDSAGTVKNQFGEGYSNSPFASLGRSQAGKDVASAGSGITAFSGQAGSFMSSLGAKGGAGTGGQFTTMGAMFGPIGMGVGMALDLGLSSGKARKAKRKAKKQAYAYLANAQKELAQLKKQQVYQQSGTLARQGASGIALSQLKGEGTGTGGAYRGAEKKEHEIEYQREHAKMMAEFRRIKKSGGKGGMF